MSKRNLSEGEEKRKKNKGNLVLGIRREDDHRWERRAPLTPTHVRELIQKGIQVLIQPSGLRTFSDQSYSQVGAIVQEELNEANTILAVKEISHEKLLPNKTYMFFSHTIKAQPENMNMLDEILKKNIRLIDYECIRDKDNKRIVRFGKFAGYAGMIDSLHALGNRLMAKGHSTPFLHIGYSYCYSTLETAREAIIAMGEEISHFGLPEEFSPFTFVFTSNGNVSLGAQEIFKLLPHQMLTPEEMVDLVKNKKGNRYTVYGTVLCAEHFTEPIEGGKFNKTDYYAHPHRYRSVFYEKYAPYISVLMNCMYWDWKFPRLLTTKQMKTMTEQNKSRLLVIGDITCDIGGSIEFLRKSTSIDMPVFVYDPKTGSVHDSTTDRDFIYMDGVLFCAIDNFATELPKEATQWFGDHLLPFVEAVVKSDPTKKYEDMTDLPSEIHGAVIACHGQLTPKFKYIEELRKQNEKSFRKILLFGAGQVAGPVVEYLNRNHANEITVADINLEAAKKLCEKRKNCQAITLDVNDANAVEAIVSKQNFVISLLPAFAHLEVAKACLKFKLHMVTASYISKEMKELNSKVEKAGLTFLNEIGLDPGIDHLEAMRVIDEVKEKGGKIREFVSWCGGLPMPEASGNPFGYKFSWSPRGVLTAGIQPARYLQDHKVIDIPGDRLFKNVQPITIFPGFNLEGIPNRDATPYIKQYGIEDQVETFFRGTLRYKGWSEILSSIVDLGLLDGKKHSYLSPKASSITWNEALRKYLDLPSDGKIPTTDGIKRALLVPKGFPTKGHTDETIVYVLAAFEWLGMFSDTPISQKDIFLDALTDLMQAKMKYEKHERDMVLLHHIFTVEWPDKSREQKTTTLVAHGNKYATAMAQTVGIPVAVATELLISGKIQQRGVITPVSSEIYHPLLDALSDEGIHFLEKSSKIF